MDWEKEGITSLRSLLEWIKYENRKAKEEKRVRSHDLANGFLHTIKEWVTVLTPPSGNANYFCIQLDDTKLGVTPFGSHEEWWEKPSKGFRELVATLGCRWGVILFDIPRREGL